MKVNDIIVLENKERYILLADIMHENNQYFLSAAVDEEENVDSKKFLLLKHVVVEGSSYVEIVTNEELLMKLTNNLKDAIN